MKKNVLNIIELNIHIVKFKKKPACIKYIREYIFLNKNTKAILTIIVVFNKNFQSLP